MPKPVVYQDFINALNRAAEELYASWMASEIIDLGRGFTYDLHRHMLVHYEKPVTLTNKEIILLEFMLKKNNAKCSYAELERECWEDDAMSEAALRNQIKNLRRKTYKELIGNISGYGYILGIDSQ